MSPSERTRISVALCTFNGERFLSDQLESIAKQTRLPDEMVVCDDRSTDRTLAILHDFAASAAYPIKIFQNGQNLGFTANFEGAIRRCTGDLIALSDQDDVWYPTRLERSEKEFLDHPQAGLVFSDANLIDEHNRLLGQTSWQRLGFDNNQRNALLAGRFVLLAKHRFATGATMMFRAGLRDRFLPFGAGWIHDEWMVMIVAAFSDLRPIQEPLIRYRTHDSQQVGFVNKLEKRASGNTRAERHWERVRDSAREMQQICDALSPTVREQSRPVLPVYHRHLEFLLSRSHLSLSPLARLGQVASRYQQYRVHASGPASMLKDVLLKKTC